MTEYVMMVEHDKITIQAAKYIEDGCYIEIIGKTIILFEIAYGGGNESKIGEFDTIQEAIDKSNTLT